MEQRRKSRAWVVTTWAFGLFWLIGLAQIALGALLLSQVAADSRRAVSSDMLSNAATVKGISGKAKWSAELMGGPAVWTYERLPLLGNYVRATHLASSLASDLGAEATRVISQIPDHRLRHPSKLHAADWRLISSVGVEAVDVSARALAVLHDLDVGQALPHSVRGFVANSDQVIARLNEVRRYLVAAGVVLGSPKRQTWFLANQNLAEARGTGGLIGSFAVLRVDNGHIQLMRAGSDMDLDRAGRVINGNLPIQPDAIWGMVNIADWRDVNASANPALAAQQITGSWKQRTGQSIDGVIFIGQGITRMLMAATGPLGVDGRTLSADNSVMYLTHDIYADYADPVKKNHFVGDLMVKLMDALIGKSPNLSALGKTLMHPTTGDKLWVWSANLRQRNTLAKAGLLGVLNTSEDSATLVSLNNAGGNKLDAYIKVRSTLIICRPSGTGGMSENTLTVTLSNTAPESGLPAYTSPRLDLGPGESRKVGSNRDLITVYLPKRSLLAGFTIDGEYLSAGDYEDSGREILVFDLDTDPGASHTVVISFLRKSTSALDSRRLLQSSAQFAQDLNAVLEKHCG